MEEEDIGKVELSRGQSPHTEQTLTSQLSHSIKISKSDSLIAGINQEMFVHFYDLEANKAVCRLFGHTDEINGVVLPSF